MEISHDWRVLSFHLVQKFHDDPQISNDPGGNRWLRHHGRLVLVWSASAQEYGVHDQAQGDEGQDAVDEDDRAREVPLWRNGDHSRH